MNQFQKDTPIKKMGFFRRTENCLLAEGIETLGDLLPKSEAYLLKVPNLGRKTLTDIKDVLAARGLYLSLDYYEQPSQKKTSIKNQPRIKDMTLLDHFAQVVLRELVIKEGMYDILSGGGEVEMQCRWAYDYARQMMKERSL